MKVSKIFKYIFIIFVIAILSYAGYKIYRNKKQPNNKVDNTQTVQNDGVIKDIRLGIANFDSINPLITKNREILNIDTLIFEPLFTISKDYKLQPCLATEWSKTGDNIYVIKLDNSIKWQNGAYVTAKDIQFTIDKLKEGSSIYKSNVADITKVEVVDASTIKITLDKNVPFFEYNLTFPIMSDIYYYGDNFYTSKKVPIGTGRFNISDINQTTITLSKNTGWKGIDKEDSKINTIKINLYPSMGDVFNNFKLGNIDLLNTTNMDYKDYVGTIGFNLTESAGRSFDYISLNCQDKVLQDKNVRQAINYAIDKENIVSSVYNNQRTTSNYPLDYGSYLYTNDNNGLGYNLDQAKKILEDNGWNYTNNKWQKDSETLKLKISVQKDNDGRLKTAQIIKGQLEDMGISVSIEELSNQQYQNCLSNKEYQMLITGIYNSYSPDLSYFFGDNNIENYHNDDVSGILNSGISSQDEKTLNDQYQKIYSIYKDEIPFIGLNRNKNITISSTSLAGQIEENNYSDFYDIADWFRR